MAGTGIFTGVALARVDGKGRLALPAALRNEIPESAGGRIFIAKHESQPCLIGAGADLIVRIKEYIAELAEAAREMGQPFNRAATSTRLYGGAAVPIDGSGRFVMPDVQAEAGRIGEDLIFLGRGDVFEIWDINVLLGGTGEEYAAAQDYARAAIIVRDRDEKRKKGGAE